MLGEEEAEEYRASSVAFVSSPSESEEEEYEIGASPPKPTLRLVGCCLRSIV